MEKWLKPALDYVPAWLEMQMRQSEQPGCIVAIAHRGQPVLEQAFGSANLETGETLTPRHRFRIASHSKSFTASAIMLLRERGKLRLDDAVGAHVRGLHPRVARVTLAQLLSHSAGLVRDGADAGQFTGRRDFLSREELLADLKAPPAIDPNTRFKYSNHGFALLGLVIEAAGGAPYRDWIRREVIEAAGLTETTPDMPHAVRARPYRALAARAPLDRARRRADQRDRPRRRVRQHRRRSGAVLLSARSRSLLAVESRREMIRPQWRNPHASLEGHYGLGIMSGKLGDWDWFGHSGGLLGYISRTAALRDRDLAVSVLTNAVDGWAGFWLDGVIHILRGFVNRGAPTRRVSGWTGRWWSAWGAVDLVPMGDVVLITNPHMGNPFLDVSEIAVTGRDKGRIALAGGYGSHGEPVRRTRDAAGEVAELWLAGSMLQPEALVAADIAKRYGGKPPGRRAGPVARSK